MAKIPTVDSTKNRRGDGRTITYYQCDLVSDSHPDRRVAAVLQARRALHPRGGRTLDVIAGRILMRREQALRAHKDVSQPVYQLGLTREPDAFEGDPSQVLDSADQHWGDDAGAGEMHVTAPSGEVWFQVENVASGVAGLIKSLEDDERQTMIICVRLPDPL